jgi:hypothetical protein
MVQVHTCVSVHCDQCRQALGSPGFEVHYPTEDVALDAAMAAGWLIGPGERLWCSACGPVLTCEAEGHQFSTWNPALNPDEQQAGREYRYCRRCCLHESHQSSWLIGGATGQGKSSLLWSELPAATRTTAGEVA